MWIQTHMYTPSTFSAHTHTNITRIQHISAHTHTNNTHTAHFRTHSQCACTHTPETNTNNVIRRLYTFSAYTNNVCVHTYTHREFPTHFCLYFYLYSYVSSFTFFTNQGFWEKQKKMHRRHNFFEKSSKRSGVVYKVINQY